MVDGVQILTEIIIADSTVNTLIGGRARKYDLPPEYKNTVNAVTVHLQSGGLDDSADVDNSIYMMKCYGGSNNPEDSLTVARAIVNLFSLGRFTVATGCALMTRITSYTQTVKDPDTGWPHVIVFISALTQETIV